MNIWPFLLTFGLPILLMLLPIVLSYLKGRKALQNAIEAYHKEVSKVNTLTGKETKIKAEKANREVNYEIKVGGAFNSRVTVSFNLADRYNYAFWLAKIFHRAPSDKMTLKSYFSNPPAAALFIVPRAREKVVDKSMDHLSEMNILDISALGDFIVATDRPRSAGKFFSSRIVTLMQKLEEQLFFLLLDYSSPHLKVRLEIKEGQAEAVFLALELLFRFSRRISQVKRPKGEEQATKFLKKSLKGAF